MRFLIFLLVAAAAAAVVNGDGFPAGVLTLERAFPANKTVELEVLLARDRVRHARMLQRFSGGIVDFNVVGTSDPYYGGLYFTKVKLGSPPKEFNVQIDTGSDILWVTCSSCSDCPQSSGFGLELNFFDAGSSSTASAVSCSDSICSSIVQTADASCSKDNQCGYEFHYGDGSGTSGHYVTDLLYFDTIVGPSMIANSSAAITFGCSTYQMGSLTKPEKAIDGIFGFGKHGLSVMSQLSSRGITPKVFSHCLKGDGTGGGKLVLGEILDPTMVYSPLVPSQPHYNLDLQSIAVNGQMLPIDPAVFATSDNKGTIVDTGTTLTYLVEEAFEPFVNAISGAVLQSTTPVIVKETQCYMFKSSMTEIFPEVSLNFAGGASMILKPENYLVRGDPIDGGIPWCIGFQKVQNGVSILGDLVLKDKIFVYDLSKKQIGWTDYDCSNDVNVSITTSKDEFRNAGELNESSSSRTTRVLLALLLYVIAVTLGYSLCAKNARVCKIEGFLTNCGNVNIKKKKTSFLGLFKVVHFCKASEKMAAPASSAPASPSMVVVPVSLYVGDLHPDINDIHLNNAFSEYNSLSSVRVCRDTSTGRSLCYGYVNFLSPEDATRAIEDKNHTMLCGKMIRVTRANRDPDVRKSGVGNVFVKNLNDSMDNIQLQELFQKFGNILSCKVSTFEDGKSKGYGFVQFELEESSNAAIENLNGTNVGGKQIYVAKFMKKSDRMLPNSDAKYTNLYIKNLDLDMTEDVLKEKFSVFGNIGSVVIVRDNNGASRGFGFVNFENPDDATKATEIMNGLNLGEKVLYVGRAQKKSEREQMLRRQFEEWRNEQISKCQGSNVYVKNIEDNVTEDELKERFSQCGTITSAKLMVNEKGISKGFGFVCFSTPEEASKAVNTHHGCMFHGKPLYVAIAQRKEERLAQLQIQYAQRMAGMAGPSAIISGGYPPVYYPSSPGIFSQVPSGPGLMYQPMGLRTGWGPISFAPPTRPVDTFSYSSMFNAPRLQRQNRGRINPSKLPSASNSGGRSGDGSDMLSSMLAAASPDIQKQILGERLYPLVNQHEPNLAAKITGMLLEMDKMELLLLLQSPASLAAKVEEAVQVLKKSNQTKVTSHESLQPNLLSAQVAVN